MKIYLLAQNKNKEYNTYDSCIVCAENAEDAKTIHPDGSLYSQPPIGTTYTYWAFTADDISCVEIGEANENQKRGVLLASFNSGG